MNAADPPPIDVLVAAATAGDEDAWAALVSRFTPLIWSVVSGFHLRSGDAADVNQTVWLRLVEHLPRLREPAALPMWIAKTARHECLRVLRTSRRTWLFDPLTGSEAVAGTWTEPGAAPVDDRLLQAERQHALREAFAQLPSRCQELLGLMLHDPPLSYDEIGNRMGMPVGSVGPTRGRCLHRLRQCPALAAFVNAAAAPSSERGDRSEPAPTRP
ncbi:sigma-70 family RNA polymerase sigma factor [Actinomycetes bacterium KLBMP 9797]